MGHFYRMGTKQELKTNGSLSVLIHFVFWAIVLHLLFDIAGLYYSFRELFYEGECRFDDAFIIVPLIIILFYLNTYYLIPHFLHQKSWWKYLIAIVLVFFVSTIIGRGIYQILQKFNYHFDLSLMDVTDGLVLFNLLTIGISSSLGISKMAFQNADKKRKAEAKQKEAELKYLNAQVNPHFLFNTLNSIYALSTIEEAPQTTEAILKLSEIMRYPLNEGSQEWVSLEKEIQFLEDYIDLQKIRLGENYPIKFEVKGHLEQSKIPPLLLIPLVENAFKYGVSQKEPTPILITINSQEKQIHFQCVNKIVKPENIQSHNLGINNLKSRLNLIFGTNYTLSNIQKGQEYFVDLKLLNK